MNEDGLPDVGAVSEVEEDPGTGGGAGVLAGHEKSDHDVGDFVVLEDLAAAVVLVHERGNHIVFLFLSIEDCFEFTTWDQEDEKKAYTRWVLPAFTDNVLVELTHLLVSSIPLPVTVERQPREQPMKGSETAVQIHVNLSEALINQAPDFLSLKSPSSGEDSDFGHCVKNVERTPFVDIVHLVRAEIDIVVHEFVDFVFDHVDIGTEVVVPETKLYEFLLFHEHFVGTVVDDIFSKDRSGKMLQGFKMKRKWMS